eukprot:s183_g3.t2
MSHRVICFVVVCYVPAVVSVVVEGLGHVYMYQQELQLLEKYLHAARTFFEFGMGASTLHVASEFQQLEKIVSVDMDKKWVNRVRKHAFLSNGSLSPRRIKLLHVYIGRTVGYGFPLQNMSRCRYRIRLCDRGVSPECAVKTRCYHGLIGRRSWWPSFSQAVLDAAARYKHRWDVVLVDSRFRTACALKSLMAISAQDIHRSVVMVHDYWVRRPLYSAIERFADIDAARMFLHVVFLSSAFLNKDDSTEILLAGALGHQPQRDGTLPSEWHSA